MNRERLLVVADAIAMHADNFTMTDWIRPSEGSLYSAVINLRDCKTAGCIADWTCACFPEEVIPGDSAGGAAARILDLMPDESVSLFLGEWSESGLSAITADEAAAHLRKLAGAA